MGQLSRPVQILLLGTALFATAWFVALRPKTEAEPAAAPAAKTAAPSTAGTADGVPAGSRAAAAPGAAATGAFPAVKPLAGPGGPARSTRALAAHKVLAVLFYNPRAADDRAVRKGFARLSRRRGKVVLIVAPLARLASFGAVTARVAVAGSPTVVIFDRAGTPSSYVGFADPAELGVRISDALAAKA